MENFWYVAITNDWEFLKTKNMLKLVTEISLHNVFEAHTNLKGILESLLRSFYPPTRYHEMKTK